MKAERAVFDLLDFNGALRIDAKQIGQSAAPPADPSVVPSADASGDKRKGAAPSAGNDQGQADGAQRLAWAGQGGERERRLAARVEAARAAGAAEGRLLALRQVLRDTRDV